MKDTQVEKLMSNVSSLKMVIFSLQVTAESFIDGGFFKTGDTVTLDDDGYFVILGRKYRLCSDTDMPWLLFSLSWCYYLR